VRNKAEKKPGTALRNLYTDGDGKKHPYYSAEKSEPQISYADLFMSVRKQWFSSREDDQWLSRVNE